MLLTQEALAPDVVRGQEETCLPAKLLEDAHNARTGAGSTIIESEEKWPLYTGPCQQVENISGFVGNRCGDGLKMSFKLALL